ncbi:MAG TPA: aspartate kinase [Bacteroidia bacterium]|jgi:aspartate kinase|nr:aspartate kinase [Bacteroidia bacterium]
MKVFKFGGASVKDAAGVKNVAAILKLYPKEEMMVVVSAMGKITNALEKAVRPKNKSEEKEVLEEIKQYHLKIAQELFKDKKTLIFSTLEKDIEHLQKIVSEYPTKNYDERYDQVVSMGEVMSSHIVSAYLSAEKIENEWIDAREIICTDNNYREAKVDYDKTCEKLKAIVIPAVKKKKIAITQGFIGRTAKNKTTTLGREGSDYTAAILAYCSDAESVTIWKDVPGVLNADPKWFDNTVKIDHLSFQDAIELSYYGATVIHPKTIKPLQNKSIPLYVKSFIEPKEEGTCINNDSTQLPVPCFIFKVSQVLISVSPKDFSFIVEESLSHIFDILARYKVKTNVIQNSAINFSLCTDDDENKVPALIEALRKDFRVLYNKNLELVTIRYYDQPTIDRVCIDKKILLEHKSRYTVQIVMQDSKK